MVGSNSSSRCSVSTLEREHVVQRGAPVTIGGSDTYYTYKRSNPTKVRQKRGRGNESSISSDTDTVNSRIVVTQTRSEVLSDGSSVDRVSDYNRDIILTPHPARRVVRRERSSRSRSDSKRSSRSSSRRSSRSIRRSNSRRSKGSHKTSERILKVKKIITEEVYEDKPPTPPRKPARTHAELIDMSILPPAPETASSRYVLQFKKSHLARILDALRDDAPDTNVALIVKASQLTSQEEYDRMKQERRRNRNQQIH